MGSASVIMTLVLLTGDNAEHRYVANRLCAELDIAAIIVENGPQLSRQARLRQLRKRYTTGQLVGRAALAGYLAAVGDRRARSAQLADVLGESSRSFQRPDLITEVGTVNDDDACSVISDLDPSRVLVYGTGIVRDRVLALSRETPLNMHTGISPLYRGSACAFWPIHNGEPHMCGATVHEITSKVDAGAIFATAPAALNPGDGLHAIFARAVVVGADLYVETVGRLDAEPATPGSTQDLSIGHEYRSHMRGLRAEITARRKLRAGLLDSTSAGEDV